MGLLDCALAILLPLLLSNCGLLLLFFILLVLLLLSLLSLLLVLFFQFATVVKAWIGWTVTSTNDAVRSWPLPASTQ